MNDKKDSAHYMRLALQLAEKGRFTVSPNPMVGCVIVKDGQIVGEGFHDKAGNPHAEIYAMRDAGSKAEGATVYLTLEPCCHYGRTPPCTDALIKAKVKKVVIPGLDPNPLVAGKGVEALRAVGIEVEVGIETERALQLNEIFFHYITHQRPYVILKWAMSLDGKTMTHVKDSRQISCPETQYHAHQLRREVDAILIGANTAIRDDPQLTARLDRATSTPEKQPLRIILSNKNKLPLNLKLFSRDLPGKTLLITTDSSHQAWYKEISDQGVEVLMMEKNKSGQVNLPLLLDTLGQRSITSLLVEGGMTVQHDFIQEHLVNKFHVYLANKIIGTLEKKHEPIQVTMNQLGTDFHFTGYCEEAKMFSGIVETIGTVRYAKITSDAAVYHIQPQLVFDDLHIGDSISVNGVCLTITELLKDGFSVTAVPETLRLTNLGGLIEGSQVNLERALLVGSRNGGHNVQGHIDCVGTVLDVQEDGNEAWLVKFSIPKQLSHYLVDKGFITIDGMSITLIEAKPEWFTVTFIPHTKAVSIVTHYKIDTRVNLEIDVLAKYVEKMIRATDF